MKKIILIICITLPFISCNKNNKTQENVFTDNSSFEQSEQNKSNDDYYFNKKMYVNASSGLRVRSTPGMEGERIGVLENNTEVNIIKANDDWISLDGVEGRWVYINSPIEGWIFNGYLAEELLTRKNMI